MATPMFLLALLFGLMLACMCDTFFAGGMFEGFSSSTPSRFVNYCLTGNPRVGSDFPTFPGYVCWKNMMGDQNDLAASGLYSTNDGGPVTPYLPEYIKRYKNIPEKYEYTDSGLFYKDSSVFCKKFPGSQRCPGYWEHGDY